ncbi:MAG: 3-deoxy-7-phosphoheptulonate synthase [Saccharofermentans sp.]|jgi:3-deoxy-7-phosphoheptulonate synthase|nr:3-deoxy-7-phosphoheptulonate synthase [Mageeibacillus sp.]MCI1263543.1 3-deoxy-7-phosphoheptulonate synthase [Saccharofermentans sp.]MCI1274518.1 3-deoxy-7-phosphoheptulonate synthase [Saccharofermentans sp.]
MIAVLKNTATKEQIDNLVGWFEDQGLKVNESKGDYCTVIGLIGDTTKIDIEMLQGLDIIDSVTRVSEPFKKANRKFHPEDTVIDCGGVLIGGGNFAVMAGPCSVESREQIIETAKAVKDAGATMLRGGAFKPRTSPYDFQGLKEKGIELLLEAKAVTGLPIVTEIMNEEHIPLFADIDVIQVGARNMQNFELLKALGKTNKPILLKRGLSATMKELLMSAEYIMSEGNENVILCERGIRTYETYTRNTFDLSAIPMLHELTHLPVVADPSHATGRRSLIRPMSMAATACGADALEIEVHPNPSKAFSDGAQSLTPDMFKEVMEQINKVRGIL